MTRKKHINKVLESIAKGDVNSKNFWSQIKEIGRKSQIETKNIVDDDGHIIDDPSLANEYIENYYKMLYTIRPATSEFIEFEKEVYEFTNNIIYEHNKRHPITTDEVLRAIKTLKINKSTGPDQVSNRLIKYLDIDNVQNLTHYLNQLYQANIVPNQ